MARSLAYHSIIPRSFILWQVNSARLSLPGKNLLQAMYKVVVDSPARLICKSLNLFHVNKD